MADKHHPTKTPSLPNPDDQSEQRHPSALETALAPGWFEMFLEQHAKKLLLGVVLVALAVITWSIAKALKSNRETVSAHVLSESQTLPEVLKVAETSKSSLAGGSALILASDMQFREGKPDLGIGTLTTFRDEYKSHPLRANALFGLAARRQLMKDFDTAHNEFQQIIDEFPNHILAGLARLRQGDIELQKNNKAAGIKIWDELETTYANHPGSVVIPIVKQRIDYVNAGLPTVETDAPAPPAPTSPILPETIDSLLPQPGVPGENIPLPPQLPSTDPAPAPAPTAPSTDPAPAPDMRLPE